MNNGPSACSALFIPGSRCCRVPCSTRFITRCGLPTLSPRPLPTFTSLPAFAPVQFAGRLQNATCLAPVPGVTFRCSQGSNIPVPFWMRKTRTRSAPRSGERTYWCVGSRITWCGCGVVWRPATGPGLASVKGRFCTRVGGGSGWGVGEEVEAEMEIGE